MKKGKRIHFIGVGGAGMSALAQMAKWSGYQVSGSDRAFDRNQASLSRKKLEAEGVKIYPQDGSGVARAEAVVFSAAVEAAVPDIVEARKRGLELLKRWEFLKRIAQGKRTLAIAGTDGKSTTAALIGWILEKNNYDPSLLLGANLRGEGRGLGNARRGESEWFCFEADESDGGLGAYHPEIGIITNISLDHFGFDHLQELFSGFARSCERIFITNADCPRSRKLGAVSARRITFSTAAPADYRAQPLSLQGDRSRFRLRGWQLEVPLGGLHNVYNSLAAGVVASELGIGWEEIGAALRQFPGLQRRLEVVYSGRVTVIDDYAHNPAEIGAALKTARFWGERVISIYQPHGFAPLRRSLNELAVAFSRGLFPGDILILLPVYYAGGTVQSKLGPADLKKAIASRAQIKTCRERREVMEDIKSILQDGDVVMVMGARDPTLGDFAREMGGLASKREKEGRFC